MKYVNNNGNNQSGKYNNANVGGGMQYNNHKYTGNNTDLTDDP